MIGTKNCLKKIAILHLSNSGWVNKNEFIVPNRDVSLLLAFIVPLKLLKEKVDVFLNQVSIVFTTALKYMYSKLQVMYNAHVLLRT